jgi:1-aminocyclopropane-1-carboxylate deaminase
MLRLDVLHPVVSGNKWYKLKYNMAYAIGQGYNSVLTFGGPYSNHLIATAAAANAYGIKSLGVVRGRDAADKMTQTLKSCEEYGMQLVFVTREDYSKKNDAAWLEALSNEYGAPFIIPEGGANGQGRAGAEEIAGLVTDNYTHICLSVGTGTSFEGIRNGLPETQAVLGYAPMKGGTYLADEISKYVSTGNWQLFDDWHFGGFAKWNDELLAFMNDFYTINEIPLDVVYTAKMMYGIQQQMDAGFFPDDAVVLCIHTGGLQGNSGVAGSLVYGSP